MPSFPLRYTSINNFMYRLRTEKQGTKTSRPRSTVTLAIEIKYLIVFLLKLFQNLLSRTLSRPLPGFYPPTGSPYLSPLPAANTSSAVVWPPLLPPLFQQSAGGLHAPAGYAASQLADADKDTEDSAQSSPGDCV
jgi:hypothetical protein